MNECQQVNIGPIHRHDGDTDNKNRTSFLFLTTPHKTANSNHLLSVFQRLFDLLTFLFCCPVYLCSPCLLVDILSREKSSVSLGRLCLTLRTRIFPLYQRFIENVC